MRHKSLDLGCEGDGPLRPPEIKRLRAVAVTDEMKPAMACVPQCEGRHAVEPRGELAYAPDHVAGNQHLGVRARTERPAEALELTPQIQEIVDFAIVDDHNPPVGRDHR